MSLELPPRVRSGVFLFFMSLRGAEQHFFCGVFSPNSKAGNFRLHSTRFNYLRFYKYGIHSTLPREAAPMLSLLPSELCLIIQPTGAKATYAGYHKGTSQWSLGASITLMKNMVRRL